MSNLASNNSKKILGPGFLNDAATQVANSANSFGTNVAKVANSVGTNVVKAANSVGTNVVKAANSVGTTVANSANSFGTNLMGTKATNSLQNGFNTFSNSATNTVNNVFGPLTNNSSATSSWSDWALPAGVFMFLVVLFIFLLSYFLNEIKAGYTNLSNAIRSLFNAPASPPVPLTLTAAPTTQTPPPTQPTHAQLQSQSILESVLPLKGPPEVFNISKNEFSYYDAEPLCKALGAELATYDQIKDAYGKGADWCNYGWVKGQVAVYPTQKATWDELQSGVADERDACGKPGINGGFFDNPEMKFGVNCYGAKPGQSAHDEAELMKQGRLPSTVSSLKTEQKVKEFEAQATTLGIMPFNKTKWQV